MKRYVGTNDKKSTSIVKKEHSSPLSLSLFGYRNRSHASKISQINNQVVPYQQAEITPNELIEQSIQHQMMGKNEIAYDTRCESYSDHADGTTSVDDFKTINMEPVGKLQRSTLRAMQDARIESSKNFFCEYFIFDPSDNTCTIAPVRENKIYDKEVSFHHLLESFSVHIHEFYFRDNNDRLKLVFPTDGGTIEFSIGLYRKNDPTKPQIHIFHKGMFKYEDLLFVKNNSQDKSIALYMNSLLRTSICDIQKKYNECPDGLITDILKFLMLTHVAETYRPAEHGHLTLNDCSSPSLEQQLNPRILSRTPGSGKYTRAFLDLVIKGTADFSIDSLTRHLPFVSKGGTSLQRKLSLGLEPMSPDSIKVESNMSQTSDVFIASQLQQMINGEKKIFATFIRSNRIEFVLQKNTSYYYCEIIELDLESDDGVSSSEIETYLTQLISINSKEFSELQIVFRAPSCMDPAPEVSTRF